MLDPKLITPKLDEIDHMGQRGLYTDFLHKWSPIQKALYLGQLRDQHGKTVAERAKMLEIDEEDAKLEMQALWGVFLWEGSLASSVPLLRD